MPAIATEVWISYPSVIASIMINWLPCFTCQGYTLSAIKKHIFWVIGASTLVTKKHSIQGLQRIYLHRIKPVDARIG